MYNTQIPCTCTQISCTIHSSLVDYTDLIHKQIPCTCTQISCTIQSSLVDYTDLIQYTDLVIDIVFKECGVKQNTKNRSYSVVCYNYVRYVTYKLY